MKVLVCIKSYEYQFSAVGADLPPEVRPGEGERAVRPVRHRGYT